ATGGDQRGHLGAHQCGRDQQGQGAAKEDEHGQDRQVVNVGNRHAHLVAPLGATCSISCWTEGEMRSSTGRGKTPSTMMRIMTGAMTQRSLVVASAMTAFSPAARP